MAEKRRCEWSAGGTDLMVRYHDEEWGEPVHDDRKHFEFLALEGAQAGLSWNTILSKREGYRNAFDGFDWETIARYGDKDIERLLADAGIVRNRLKVASVIANAQAFIKVRDEFGNFNEYVWQFVEGKPKVNARRSMREVPASTPESDKLSQNLKGRGFKFVGTTIVYAHMQATGLVNDHEVTCFRYNAV
jgi:DNA-3-methyladenine glycosylase I